MAESTIRCFMGVSFFDSKAVNDRLQYADSNLAGFRLTRPDQWHVTLAFMPQLAPVELPKIVECCTQQLADIPPFVATIGGFGAFPCPRKPSVIWLSTGPELKFQQLYEAIEPFVPTEKNEVFRPHLTVARAARNHHRTVQYSNIAELCQEELPPVEVPVDEVTLFQSVLTSEGSRYSVLHRWKLTAAPGNS